MADSTEPLRSPGATIAARRYQADPAEWRANHPTGAADVKSPELVEAEAYLAEQCEAMKARMRPLYTPDEFEAAVLDPGRRRIPVEERAGLSWYEDVQRRQAAAAESRL